MQFTGKTLSMALGVGLAGALMVPGLASAADADVAKHFKNKTVTVLIPYGPGGTYDKYGQTFTRHMDKYIPGEPTMIVQHMPGAGGVKAMNYAYNVMPKNGLNMITPLDNTVVNQLLRPEKMRYQSEKFIWLGATNQTNVILVVGQKKGVSSLEDWKKSGTALIGSSSGLGSTSTLIPRYVMSALKLKGKVVAGYKGSSASIFAVERGEADMSAFNWLAWSSKVPHWFEGDKPFAKAFVQAGVWKDPDLQDVPMLEDVVPEEYKAGAKFLGTLGPLGRGLALPPGVPNLVIGPLRTAYDKMNADPAFAAELEKRKLRLIPSKGADIQKTVEEAMKASTPEVIAFVRKAIYPEAK